MTLEILEFNLKLTAIRKHHCQEAYTVHKRQYKSHHRRRAGLQSMAYGPITTLSMLMKKRNKKCDVKVLGDARAHCLVHAPCP